MKRIKRTAWFLWVFVVFAPALHAGNGVTLQPFTTGTFEANLKMMVAGGPDEKIQIPIPFYVIRHPRGIVLFDSGLGADFHDQVRGWWLHRWMQALLPDHFDPSEAAVNQLGRSGISPDDVKFIIVSHLHLDHAGGLRDFPKSTVVVSRAEWENANVGRWKARFRGVMKEELQGIENRLQLVDDRPGTDFGPFAASYDFFGDGSLIVLSTPGHTPGHQSLLVTLDSGNRVLLTGDAVWLRENYLWPAPKSWLVRHLEENADEAWKTVLKIREFAAKNPDIFIIPGHDPHLWKELPEAFR